MGGARTRFHPARAEGLDRLALPPVGRVEWLKQSAHLEWTPPLPLRMLSVDHGMNVQLSMR